jgi:hypothetical protein
LENARFVGCVPAETLRLKGVQAYGSGSGAVAGARVAPRHGLPTPTRAGKEGTAMLRAHRALDQASVVGASTLSVAGLVGQRTETGPSE